MSEVMESLEVFDIAGQLSGGVAGVCVSLSAEDQSIWHIKDARRVEVLFRNRLRPGYYTVAIVGRHGGDPTQLAIIFTDNATEEMVEAARGLGIEQPIFGTNVVPRLPTEGEIRAFLVAVAAAANSVSC